MEAVKLYKSIRRLHRALPPPLRIVGNNYVRDEFKRHATAEKGYLIPFFIEWHKYRDDLRTQLQSETIGRKLDTKHMNGLSDAQLGQLFSLYEATNKKLK